MKGTVGTTYKHVCYGVAVFSDHQWQLRGLDHGPQVCGSGRDHLLDYVVLDDGGKVDDETLLEERLAGREEDGTASGDDHQEV